MIQIQNLSYNIGERYLLKEVRWTIPGGQRAALIGANGAGKTTLLRILSGALDHFDGTIIKPRNFKIGYLPQEEIAFDKGIILRLVMEGNQEAVAIEEELESIHERLNAGKGDMAALVHRSGELEARYTVIGGYDLEARARKILAGLGFKQDQFHRPLHDLSGGWRMRVFLARLLVQEPDLLLLDEPTNHLDLDALEWMETYLKSFRGSMVLVSHDRFFIDRLAQHIAELDRGRLTHYSGGYHFYEEQKELQKEQLLKKWLALKEERERVQRFIDRFRYKATKAAQVQSRIKALEKMEQVEAPDAEKTIHFSIKADSPSYKEALTMRDLYFRYDHDWVIKGVNIEIFRGDKIALVGPNGAGKTTFTRITSGELTPQQGDLKLGERVRIGYYAQHQIDTLNLNNTVLQEVEATAARSFLPRLRDILGIFRFSGDDVNKPVGVLSGGEKARVSLAKILLSPCNFLIMDEPTNHLDIASRQALEKALAEYDGTLLLISHDRYFLDKLVRRVCEMHEGQMRLFEGNYSDYLARREQESELAQTQVSPTAESEPLKDKITGRKSKDQKRLEAAARQSVSKDRRRLRDEIERLETEILRREERKAELENSLSDPATYQDGERTARLRREYEQICSEIPQLEAQWEISQAAYDELVRALDQKD